jgi:hypothetical protein
VPSHEVAAASGVEWTTVMRVMADTAVLDRGVDSAWSAAWAWTSTASDGSGT